MSKLGFYLFCFIYGLMIGTCLVGSIYMFTKGSYVMGVIGLGVSIWLLKPSKD